MAGRVAGSAANEDSCFTQTYPPHPPWAPTWASGGCAFMSSSIHLLLGHSWCLAYRAKTDPWKDHPLSVLYAIPGPWQTVVQNLLFFHVRHLRHHLHPPRPVWRTRLSPVPAEDSQYQCKYCAARVIIRWPPNNDATASRHVAVVALIRHPLPCVRVTEQAKQDDSRSHELGTC